jgi:hypothetical protein
MLFHSSNYDDIIKYYKNTYVKFKETGDRLFYIRTVDRHSVRGIDQDDTEFELWLSDDHPYEVDYILPNKSFFQFNKRACLLQRIPAKQFQRGLSGNNTKITALTKAGSNNNLDLNFELLKSFVAKQHFPDFITAVRNKGRFASVALSSRFAYVPDRASIMLDNTIVAQVDKDNKRIVMSYKIFYPEVCKLTEDSNYEVVYA